MLNIFKNIAWMLLLYVALTAVWLYLQGAFTSDVYNPITSFLMLPLVLWTVWTWNLIHPRPKKFFLKVDIEREGQVLVRVTAENVKDPQELGEIYDAIRRYEVNLHKGAI